MKSFRSPSAPPPGGPYSPGIQVGDLLFVSGQAPMDAEGKVVGRDFATQARATFDNINKIAAEAGTSLKHAVRIGAYLSSLNYFEDFNTIMTEYVSEPYPTRTTIPVALRGFDIEIDAVLAIPKD